MKSASTINNEHKTNDEGNSIKLQINIANGTFNKTQVKRDRCKLPGSNIPKRGHFQCKVTLPTGLFL